MRAASCAPATCSRSRPPRSRTTCAPSPPADVSVQGTGAARFGGRRGALVRTRRAAAEALSSAATAPGRRAAIYIGKPASAWLLFNADIALWHVPSLYDSTLHNAGVHYLEHVSFIVLGVLFWVHVFDSPPLRVRLNYTWQLAYIISAATASWLLAVVLAIATHPLYGAYAALPHRPGGISALADQQLAAGMMLGPGSITFAIAVFYGIYAWLGADERPRSARLAARHG